MRTHLIAVSATLLSLSLFATGCAVETDDTGSDESEVREGGVSEFMLAFSDLETSTTRSAKAAKMKIKGRAAQEELARCHQYNPTGNWNSDIIVCRDGKREIIMDATYAMEDNYTRWARIRTPNGADQTFQCKQVSEQNFSTETYGGMTGHLCKPKAFNQTAKKMFQTIDAAPVFSEYPTRSPYLQTTWAKDRPETWASWKKKIGNAVPVGEYTGYGRTGSKKCKVKIAEKGDGYEISIHSIDDAGRETRLNAKMELSSKMTFGAHRQENVPQQVASTTRPATIIIAQGETETRTRDYYSRAFRVVRYPDAPASADAGHTAIFIDDNYCQRLSPALPEF